MRDGEPDHYQDDVVVDEPGSDLLVRPVTDVASDAVCSPVKDDHGLPPGDEDYTFDAEKLQNTATVRGWDCMERGPTRVSSSSSTTISSMYIP